MVFHCFNKSNIHLLFLLIFMSPTEIDQRISHAIAFFKQGYNCSQAVFMAYSDLYGIDSKTAAKLATSFGGGMGRMREVCGAVSGMFLVLGMHYPFTDTTNKAAKNRNYTAVQLTAEKFKAEKGSYICADLLNTKREPQNPQSTERDEAFYKLRPCEQCVALAAKIVGNEIAESI